MASDPRTYDSLKTAKDGGHEIAERGRSAAAHRSELRKSFIPLLFLMALFLAVDLLPTHIKPLDWIIGGSAGLFGLIVALGVLIAICRIVVALATPVAKGWIDFVEKPGEVLRPVWVIVSGMPRILLLALAVGLLWAGWKYHKIEDDTQRRANSHVPVQTSSMKRDIALIVNKSESIEWGDTKRRIVWSIKIPSSNLVYYAEWDIGFNQFRKDDAVVFLHEPFNSESGTANNPGYIVGIHDAQRGRITLVDTIEQESADEAYDAGHQQ